MTHAFARSYTAFVRGRERTWLVAAAAAAWLVVFGRLGYSSLLDPDEAHYAQLTREMMRSHSWLVPLLDGTPFIDKPVLFHWLQIASIRLFGDSEFALRLPSALAGISLVFVTRWLGAALFGAAVGNVAALMFVTLPLTFALANIALFDMVYTAFLFSAVACLVVSAVNERPRLQYAGYGLLSLAVMTKGPVALLLVLLLMLAAMAINRTMRQRVHRLNWQTGLLLVAVIASPWFIYMWTAFPERFVRDYLLAGNLWYFTAPKAFSSRVGDYTFYFRTFLGAFFPWSLVVVGYAVDSAVRREPRSPLRPGEPLLFLWITLVLAFFSVAGFKLDWYIFPAAPACCVLAARAWIRAETEPSQRATKVAVAAAALVLTVGGVIAAATLFRIDLGVDLRAAVLPLALAIGGLALLLQLVRRRFLVLPSVAAPVTALLTVYLAVIFLGIPILERSRPTAPLGRWINQHTEAGEAVGAYGLQDWRASIRYYSDRRLIPLAEPGEVRAFFERSPTSYVMMLRSDFDELRRSGLGLIEVSRRRAIVGRAGKYVRRQVWGDLLIVTDRDNPEAFALDTSGDDRR
jgi:4-amino-4-deoxy-L-arabinose transferase-like glycosyltransferase